MDELLHDGVRARANHHCEYCHFPDQFAELPFHMDHIIAQQHGGKTIPENLAWSCCYCNRYKGPNLSGVDPLTGKVVELYHPRRMSWSEHFAWSGPALHGKTATARATIVALQINRSDATAVRRLLMDAGHFPIDEAK